MEVWNRQLSEAAHPSALRIPIELARVAPFTLAGLEIDPPHKSIRSADGREEMLEPRMMQVLCALARAEGAILTRDDLTASCWAGTHVGEDALQRVIARLRKLAHGIGADRFEIETLPKIGYRLTLSEPHGTPASEKDAATLPRLGPGKPNLFVIAICLTLLLCLLAAADVGLKFTLWFNPFFLDRNLTSRPWLLFHAYTLGAASTPALTLATSRSPGFRFASLRVSEGCLCPPTSIAPKTSR